MLGNGTGPHATQLGETGLPQYSNKASRWGVRRRWHRVSPQDRLPPCMLTDLSSAIKEGGPKPCKPHSRFGTILSLKSFVLFPDCLSLQSTHTVSAPQDFDFKCRRDNPHRKTQQEQTRAMMNVDFAVFGVQTVAKAPGSEQLRRELQCSLVVAHSILQTRPFDAARLTLLGQLKSNINGTKSNKSASVYPAIFSDRH